MVFLFLMLVPHFLELFYFLGGWVWWRLEGSGDSNDPGSMSPSRTPRCRRHPKKNPGATVSLPPCGAPSRTTPVEITLAHLNELQEIRRRVPTPPGVRHGDTPIDRPKHEIYPGLLVDMEDLPAFYEYDPKHRNRHFRAIMCPPARLAEDPIWGHPAGRTSTSAQNKPAPSAGA